MQEGDRLPGQVLGKQQEMVGMACQLSVSLLLARFRAATRTGCTQQ